jgi:hypothetical protein
MVLGRGVVGSCFLLPTIVRVWGVRGFTRETAKPLITENNGKRRRRWCDDHETWTSDDWKYIIRSGEWFFMLFPTSGRVYVRRTPKKTYNPECLLPTVKHGARYVTIWAAISWYSVGPIIVLIGRITSSDCVDIIGDQVHPMVKRLFSKTTFRPYTAEVFSLGFQSVEIHFSIFPGQHSRQI